MFFTPFVDKLKVPAFRDGIYIICFASILVILGVTVGWTEFLVRFLYKYKAYHLDDFVLTFAVTGIFIMFYGIRRNREKKVIIAKQIKTEATLRKTQNNLKILLNSSSSIIYNCEAFGNFKLLYMTDNVTPILGYQQDEYFELNWWMNHIHPDDQPGVYAEFSTLFTVGFISFDYRFKHKNGHWVWMHSDSQLLYDDQGKPSEIVGTWWDISVQKITQEAIRKNNERFHLAFQATKDTIYDWDIKANSFWMSEEIYRSFGYDKSTVDIGFEWWQSKIHPEDLSMVNTSMAGILETKNHNWSGEYRFSRADNSYANVLSRGYATYDNDGTALRWVGAMSDITILKQTEIALREAKDKAEESVKFKSEFLANMSHEIRTPLNGVIGMTELTLETDVNPQQKRYLENIQSSSESLLNLINDILDFSKIDAGRLELSPSNFSLRDEMPRALQALSLKASIKKLEFIFCMEQDVPDLFFCDIFRLEQVIVNLAGNAIKFTEKGEVAVNCKLKSISNGEAVLLFSVTDSGIGIPANKLSSIFQEFTQADGSTSRQYGGTGLGLTICRSLVEMMGGTIWAESVEGKGSTFYFTLNMKLQDVKTKPRFIPNVSLDGKRVLIVEDNKSTRDYTVQLINQFRMRGFAVSSGEGAVLELNKALHNDDPYALVLLDISLDGQMDGFDVGMEIQKSEQLRNTEIIVISMSQNASDRERFGQIGISDFFSKPFSQSDLLDCIQNKLLSTTPGFKEQIVLPRSIKIAAGIASTSLKILLVEDNIINQEVAFNMLSRLGHVVTIANNGLEAVSLVQKENFDLVFMDVQMPKMNGYDATMKIRENEKESGSHMHIIGLTANAMNGDKEKCLEKGMDDYVSKPIRFEDMIKAIQRFTDRLNSTSTGSGEKIHKGIDIVNLEGLLERLSGDHDIFEQFMTKIPKHITTSFQKLVEAVDSDSAEDVEFAAHTMRGICLNLDMYKVTDITLEIENLASQNKLSGLTLLMSALENEMAKALDYIKGRKDLLLEAV